MHKVLKLLDRYNGAPDIRARQQAERVVWDRYGCLAAPFVLDLSGFSRTVRRHGIVHYLALMRRMQRIAAEAVPGRRGRIVKFEADNCFAVFERVADAVDAGHDIHAAFAEANRGLPRSQRLAGSVGIAWGRILLVPDTDYFGDAVNLACKLGEDLGEAGEILLTSDAARRLPKRRKLDLEPVRYSISGLQLDAARLRPAVAAS